MFDSTFNTIFTVVELGVVTAIVFGVAMQIAARLEISMAKLAYLPAIANPFVELTSWLPAVVLATVFNFDIMWWALMAYAAIVIPTALFELLTGRWYYVPAKACLKPKDFVEFQMARAAEDK